MSKELIYIADPMCSWCWGFAPVITTIRSRFTDNVAIKIIVGGLRAGETRLLTEKGKHYIAQHWHNVHETTGQPFDFAFFAREGFVYDTEPACRAVVTVREFAPSAALDYFSALQEAFYANGRDIRQTEVLTAIAIACGVPADAFASRFDGPMIREATLDDFRLTQRLAVPGFPALLANESERLVPLTLGYSPLETLLPALQTWLTAKPRVSS